MSFCFQNNAVISFLQIKEHFKCPICLSFFVEELLSTNCGHLICQTCWENLTEKKCPICKETTKSHQVFAIKALIESFEVSCNSVLCDFRGSLSNISKHVKGCKANEAFCLKCDKKILKYYENIHCKLTHQNTMICFICQRSIRNLELSQHLNEHVAKISSFGIDVLFQRKKTRLHFLDSNLKYQRVMETFNPIQEINSLASQKSEEFKYLIFSKDFSKFYTIAQSYETNFSITEESNDEEDLNIVSLPQTTYHLLFFEEFILKKIETISMEKNKNNEEISNQNFSWQTNERFILTKENFEVLKIESSILLLEALKKYPSNYIFFIFKNRNQGIKQKNILKVRLRKRIKKMCC